MFRIGLNGWMILWYNTVHVRSSLLPPIASEVHFVVMFLGALIAKSLSVKESVV